MAKTTSSPLEMKNVHLHSGKILNVIIDVNELWLSGKKTPWAVVLLWVNPTLPTFHLSKLSEVTKVKKENIIIDLMKLWDTKS